MVTKAQFQIQQMAFLILAVFFFFILVGLFFMSFQYGNIKSSAASLQKQQAIASLATIANMPELNCDSRTEFCIDLDKLKVMSNNSAYSDLWPVASVNAQVIYPSSTLVKCPFTACNYYEIYNSNQKNVKEYSLYVSICEKKREEQYTYDDCKIGKLIVGVKISE